MDVLPEVDDTIDIVIRDEDLKRDVFRCGGPGGQHQNKTESGVRYTHIPTGVAAESRTERSQHKNDSNAMALLKAKLIRREEEKREAEYAKKYDEKGDVSFGSQIRSYVLQPYQKVKDARTDFEVGNPRAVLDGEIDGFIESYLRAKLAGSVPPGEGVTVPSPTASRLSREERRGPGRHCSARGSRIGFARTHDRWSHALIHARPRAGSRSPGSSRAEPNATTRLASSVPSIRSADCHELPRRGGPLPVDDRPLVRPSFLGGREPRRRSRQPEALTLDFDVADRCRAPIESLAATYVLRLDSGALAEASPGRIAWNLDGPSPGRLELLADAPCSLAWPRPAVRRCACKWSRRIQAGNFTHRLRYRWRWTSSVAGTR